MILTLYIIQKEFHSFYIRIVVVPKISFLDVPQTLGGRLKQHFLEK
jgi:hypothetical protein